MLERLAEIVTGLGQKLLAWRDTGGAEGEWQGPNFKARADAMAHDYFIDQLERLFPGMPIISEEDASSHIAVRPERYFIIDPIDGTASYANGFQGYVTQVALMDKGQPVQAAVYAPAFKQLYLAEAGSGATLNGKPLKVGKESSRRILIDNYPKPRGTASQVSKDLACTGYVECGSISLKICRIADGTADLFFKDVVIRDWDIAPPQLILTEAEGCFYGIDGTKIFYDGNFEKPGLVACNDTMLADMMLDWLARHTTDSKKEIS